MCEKLAFLLFIQVLKQEVTDKALMKEKNDKKDQGDDIYVFYAMCASILLVSV